MTAIWAICWTLLALVGVCHLEESCDDLSTNQLPDYAKKHGSEQQCLSRDSGEPLDSMVAALTFGKHGSMLLQDYVFIEMIAKFNRERTPERIVHAKGSGASGYFEVTNDITKYTKAAVFSQIGKKTRIVARFSPVAPARGSSESLRTPRGFSVKFYTEEGIWDLVALNGPVFAIRNPLLFPDFAHSRKRNPQTNIPDATASFDFTTRRPETVHEVLILHSDRGIPDGYRHMDGFGVNTFKMVNKDNIPRYVKFHLKTNQGIKNILHDRAINISGTDPDYFTRDLYNAIYRKEYPSWTMYIQVMTFEQAEKFCYNPFDPTKIWPEEEFPLICVGKLVFNKNPTNYFAEVEQIAFNPANLVPGIEPSPDPILQARLFGYRDTQLYRLGTNQHQLPINLPFAGNKITNINRDGSDTTYNQGGAPNYYPNSFSKYTTVPYAAISEFYVTGNVKRYDKKDEDNFSQARIFWNKLPEDEKYRLVENLAFSAKPAIVSIKIQIVKLFKNVCENLGKILAEKLEIKPSCLD